MKAAGAIILTIFILLIVAALGWVLFARWRAQRLGVSLHLLEPVVLCGAPSPLLFENNSRGRETNRASPST